MTRSTLVLTSLRIAMLLAAAGTDAQEVRGLPGDEFRAWATKQVFPIDTAEVRDDQSDLARLGEIVGDARVVALGESVHGAHEEMALRNRIIGYLVTERGFTAVGLETGLSPSKILYDHVLGTVEASEKEIVAAFSYGFGEFGENRDLVRWLRGYNATRPPDRRVRLYGFDLTGSFTGSARRSLDALFAYLDRVDGPLAVRLRDEYGPILPKLDTAAYLGLSAGERDRITAMLADLVWLVRRNRDRFADAGTPDDSDWALRQAIGAAQDNRYRRVYPLGLTVDAVRELSSRRDPAMLLINNEANNERDAAMADNVAWILGREGPKGRLIVYASHYHTRADRDVATGSGSRVHVPLAAHLRSRIGRDLVAIGMYPGALRGFNGPGPTPRIWTPPPVNQLLASLGWRLYAVDLRRAPAEGPLHDWIWAEHVEEDGARRAIVPARCFDAMIYIDALNQSNDVGRPH